MENEEREETSSGDENNEKGSFDSAQDDKKILFLYSDFSTPVEMTLNDGLIVIHSTPLRMTTINEMDHHVVPPRDDVKVSDPLTSLYSAQDDKKILFLYSDFSTPVEMTLNDAHTFNKSKINISN